MVYPSETVAAWDAVVASFYAATAAPEGASSGGGGDTSGALGVSVASAWRLACACVTLTVLAWL